MKQGLLGEDRLDSRSWSYTLQFMCVETERVRGWGFLEDKNRGWIQLSILQNEETEGAWRENNLPSTKDYIRVGLKTEVISYRFNWFFFFFFGHTMSHVNFSSQTRDWTHPPAVEEMNYWTTRGSTLVLNSHCMYTVVVYEILILKTPGTHSLMSNSNYLLYFLFRFFF